MLPKLVEGPPIVVGSIIRSTNGGGCNTILPADSIGEYDADDP